MKFLLLLCCAGLLSGQGTETKAKAEDYEVHAQSQNLAIGAEFTVHSYSRGEQMFIAKDYLVVEVAIFPPKGETYEIYNSDFTLRINGKQSLHTDTPTAVVANQQHPEWKQPDPNVEAGVDVNGKGASIGGPPVNRNPFPGSQPPGSQPTRTYPPVEIPPQDNPTGIEKPKVDPAELLTQTALVQGAHQAPTSGFLFFPFRGKISSIKTLEVLYHETVLKLR